MIFHFQEIYNILSPLVGGGLTALVTHVLKVRRINIIKRRNDPVAESVKNNILIESKLSEILDTYNSDRAWIIQFHNGGNFYPTGKSIPKFSIFYESVRPIADSIKDKFQGIPVSIFGKSFNYLYENNVLIIQDYNNLQEDLVNMRYISDETDSKSSYAFAIKTLDNKFVGIIGLDYVKRKNFLTDTQLTDMQLNAAFIGGSLIKHQTS